MPISTGSELARELEAFKAMESEVVAASQARFFKEQEDACLAAAETKHFLELEQQRKDQQAVKKHWQENMQEGKLVEKTARHQQRAMGLQQRQQQQVGPLMSCGFQPWPSLFLALLTIGPPVSLRTWSPPRVLECPRLDGDAFYRTHVTIASGRNPAVTDLWDAYDDGHRLDPLHPICWEPLPSLPILHNTNIGALQQELLDMQRHLNSTQLDLETERACNRMATVQTQHLEAQLADLCSLNSEHERMLKNLQVEYELLQGKVRTLADSAAASTASAAQAKAYKVLVVPGYPNPATQIKDLEGVLARYEVELRKSEEGRGKAVDRAIRREVEIGNTSQLIHNLMGTCELFVNVPVPLRILLPPCMKAIWILLLSWVACTPSRVPLKQMPSFVQRWRAIAKSFPSWLTPQIFSASQSALDHLPIRFFAPCPVARGKVPPQHQAM
ncbi:hypothetical protein BT96DRAFT_936306 [Gymnopus androsaceus JB14]|uniref:Uncharacterized protein n=1 Tax=Gymnopus androsaceus JB14 TaxID=1447944 RepID=A0A6A4I4D3_9AGAR|nr:hypothetical protein BT96DRAFT_936306 [Gymnopus androsaceus JB14]